MGSKKLEEIKDAITELLADSSFLPIRDRNSDSGNEQEVWRILRKPLRSPYDGCGQVELIENDSRTNGITQIYISGLDGNAIVLKPDLFGVKFFKRGTYNKACDYLILTKYNSIYYALFIDLKTDVVVGVNENDNKVPYVCAGNIEKAWQMAGARFLLDSILNLARKVGKIVKPANFQMIYLLVNNVSKNISASHGIAVNTAIPVAPPITIVDPNAFFWLERRNGDVIHINTIIGC